MEFYSLYRIRHLGLDGLLDIVYTPPDHSLPKGLTRDAVRLYPSDVYRLLYTRNPHTPKGELKPNPKLLSAIIRELGGSPDAVIYVGDSLMKDITMAQAAKVADVWAKYGAAHDREEYELLRRVTHWPKQDVQKEQELTGAEVRPSHILENSFGELLSLFDFGPFEQRPSVSANHSGSS
jgi:phosphoglycolate phosphatase